MHSERLKLTPCYYPDRLNDPANRLGLCDRDFLDVVQSLGLGPLAGVASEREPRYRAKTFRPVVSRELVMVHAHFFSLVPRRPRCRISYLVGFHRAIDDKPFGTILEGEYPDLTALADELEQCSFLGPEDRDDG